MKKLQYPRERPLDVEALAVKWAYNDGSETHVYIRYEDHRGLKVPALQALTRDSTSSRCYGLINEGDTIGWYRVWFDESAILPFAVEWPQ